MIDIAFFRLKLWKLTKYYKTAKIRIFSFMRNRPLRNRLHRIHAKIIKVLKVLHMRKNTQGETFSNRCLDLRLGKITRSNLTISN